jgi:hypothetical protein
MMRSRGRHDSSNAAKAGVDCAIVRLAIAATAPGALAGSSCTLRSAMPMLIDSMDGTRPPAIVFPAF